MVSNASVGSNFFPRLYLKETCWDLCGWGCWGFFLLLLIHLCFAVQQRQEPTGTFLMLMLVSYYSHLWFAFLPLKTSSKIWYHFQNECWAYGNRKLLLGELLGVTLLLESKWEGWVPLVWVWPVVFLLFSEGIQCVFFLKWSENKILLDLIDKKVLCSIVAK